MPLYCSNTGRTALREAEVQQPNTAATLSSTSSLRAFSAKVGQSLAPSSWITSILRPSTPPISLIWAMASFSACTDPVSEIAMVPVVECRMPTFTVLSVTASFVVLTASVGSAWASAPRGRSATAGSAAMPRRSLRRSGDGTPPMILSASILSEDMKPPDVGHCRLAKAVRDPDAAFLKGGIFWGSWRNDPRLDEPMVGRTVRRSNTWICV